MNRTVEHKDKNHVLHIWHKETQPDWGLIMEEINSFIGSVYFYPAGFMGAKSEFHVVLLSDEPVPADDIRKVIDKYVTDPDAWFVRKGGQS